MRLVLAVSLLTTSALAAPVTFAESGYLLAAGDAPLTEAGLSMTFRLFAAPTGGAAIWTSSACSVDVKDGYFAVILGDACNGTPALDSAHLPADSDRFLELTIGAVDAVTLLPRRRLAAVPVAATAQNALQLGGFAAASYARLDQSASFTAALTAASLSTAGNVTVTGGGQFSGQGSGLTALDAASITVGQIADAQLASGSNLAKLSGTQTLAGVKTFSNQPSFPAGLTSAGNIVASTGAKFAGDGSLLTNLPSGAGAQTNVANTFALLNTFSAGLALGNVATGCTDANAGTLRWTGISFQGCTGTAAGWVTFAMPLGLTQGTPGSSCLAIQAAGQSQSNLYWIDPNGAPTTDAYQTYCDMQTDGGGWTLVSNTLLVGNQGGPSPAQTSSTYTGPRGSSTTSPSTRSSRTARSAPHKCSSRRIRTGCASTA